MTVGPLVIGVSDLSKRVGTRKNFTRTVDLEGVALSSAEVIDDVTIDVDSPAVVTTLDVRVSASTDDAEQQVSGGNANLTSDEIGQLARRVDRLEEVLEIFRDAAPPDRVGFDALRGRLTDLGIETEMAADETDD